jgi:hypothetical protein
MRPLTPSSDKRFDSKALDRFLNLPVALLLTIGWLVGAALIGSCALAPYMLWLLLQATLGT